MIKLKNLLSIIIIVLLITVLGACSEIENSTSTDASEKADEVKTKGVLKAEDYENLYSDPQKYKGYEVELTGKIFTEAEREGNYTYFQIWADPENNEKNTLVTISDPRNDFKTNQYVKIKGVVKDKFEGENGFGATIVAPMIMAKSAEVIDYITAVAPTIKEINVDQTINQNNLVVNLEKIELAENQTRVYVKVQNQTKHNASIYTHTSKLVVANKQLEEEYVNSSDTGLAELQSELLPGIETEGVIVYPAIDPNEKSLKFYTEAYSDNYELDFQPYVFNVTIN